LSAAVMTAADNDTRE